MINFFIISLSIYIFIGFTSNKKSSKYSSNNYPSGQELKRELRNIPLYNCNNIDYDNIEEKIFRDYVYDFEKNSGYSREISLRKALHKYNTVFGIKS